jgi:iron complex outermembrane receptor protein
VVFSDPQTGRTFTQDLHLASRRDLFGISWLAGASYLHDASGYSPVRFPMPILGPLQGIGSELDINGQIQTDAVAGYAQVTYHILRNFSLTGGLRYNSETKKVTRQDVILPSFDLTIPNPGAPSEKTWDSLAVHAGIEYKPSTDWLVYFSYDQGFKSGSFNVTDPRPPVPCTQNASGFCMVPVNQEEINAYQGGVKGRFLDGRAEVELTGFYYDYTNLQTSVVGPNGSPILENAANASIYGLDFKLRAAITRSLTIQAAGTELIEAKYDRFVGLSYVPNLLNGGFNPVTADMSGNRLPRTPRFSGNVGPVYTTQIGGSKLILSSNLYYSSSYYLDPSHLAQVGSYVLWNARAEYKLANGISFAVWGRNLTQERFVQSALFLTSKLQSWNEPRMFGLTVSYEY